VWRERRRRAPIAANIVVCAEGNAIERKRLGLADDVSLGFGFAFDAEAATRERDKLPRG
jgi:hypothetical protein